MKSVPVTRADCSSQNATSVTRRQRFLPIAIGSNGLAKRLGLRRVSCMTKLFHGFGFQFPAPGGDVKCPP
jgi:hypothetical protein